MKKVSVGAKLNDAAEAALKAVATQISRLSDEELETIVGYLPAAYLYIREESLPYAEWAAGDHSRGFTYAWVVAVLAASEELRRRSVERQ